jgi:hypothetical protein
MRNVSRGSVSDVANIQSRTGKRIKKYEGAEAPESF